MRSSRSERGAGAFALAVGAGLLAGLAAVVPPAYLAAALAALGLGLLFLRVPARTEAVVALYWVAFCLFSTMLVDQVVPGIFVLFYGAMFLGVLLGSMAGGLRLDPTTVWLYAAFLLVVVLSLVGSEASLGSLAERLILYPFGALVLLQFRAPRGHVGVVATAALTSLAVAAWVVVQADQADFAYRAALDVNQNVVSFYVGIGFVVALAWLAAAAVRGARGRWAAIGVALALGVMSYSLILLASRGATIAVGATLLVLGAWAVRHRPRRLLALLAVVALAGLGLLLPGGAGLLERFESESTATGGGRTEIWRTVSVEMMAGAPQELLLGHGFDRSRELVSGSFGLISSTHSAYLLIVYDFGVIGLLLFLALHALPFVRGWRLGGVRGALVVGLVAYLLTTGLFLSTPDNFLYWAALGLVLAMAHPTASRALPVPAPAVRLRT